MLKSKSSPRVVVFAGPNGAGKSTHADAILAVSQIQIFVNADYIARGLSAPLADEWSVYDNTAVGVAELVAEFNGTTISIKVPKIWQKLQALATAH